MKKLATRRLYHQSGNLIVSKTPFASRCFFLILRFLFLFLVYQLQQEAPIAVAVLCTSNQEDANRPPYFEDEYHGCISNQDTKMLLVKDGHFLVRESGKSRGHHTLSLQCNNELKHYR